MYILHRETKERFIGKDWGRTEKKWFIVFEDNDDLDPKTYSKFPHVEVCRFKHISLKPNEDYKYDFKSQSTQRFYENTQDKMKKFIVDKTMKFLEDQGEL
jgi:hypothetical protein